MAAKDGFTVKVTRASLKRTLARLDRLELKIQKKVLRKAVRAGGGVFVKAAKRSAPVETRTLKKAITQRVKTDKRAGSIVSRINAVSKKGAGGRNAVRYLHIVHDGAAPHDIAPETAQALQFTTGDFRPAAAHPGHAGKPFLQQAFDQQNRQAFENFGTKFETEVLREVAAMGKP